MDSDFQLRLSRSITALDSVENKFQVIQELGVGTFAKVFKAKMLQNERIVAIKHVQSLQHDEESALHEVQHLQRIDNDHIVAYYNSIYDRTDKSLYIVMQLCKHSLRKQIQQKSYTQAQIMVSAFLELSSKNLMHLDLKPENILISHVSDDYYKICDFGCSQISTKSKINEYEKDDFGTFNYLAPQYYLDYRGRFTSTSADIWSLGIIVYQMIYKSLPFEVDKNGQIRRKDIESFFRVEKQILFPISTNSPKSIIKILKEMLITNPKQRITWRELEKLLIKDYNVEETHFKNVQTTYVKHLTIIKIFSTIIIICRKNMEYNPHPFWKNQSQIITELCQLLVHLCYIYCIKFRAIYRYKVKLKLQPQLLNNLQFAENNIEFEETMLCQKTNKKISLVNDIQFYEMSLLETAKEIKEKLTQNKDQCWLAMNDLLVFIEGIIACGQAYRTFFASGDNPFFKNSIQGLKITI